MAANAVHPMTVEEFRDLPQLTGDYCYELHRGELIAATRPKLKHHLLQSRLRELLKSVAPSESFIVSVRAIHLL